MRNPGYSGCPYWLTIDKYHERARRQRRPLFVACQRLGGNYRYPILRGGVFGKVDLQIFITQLRSCKRRLAHDVMQLGAGMRPQRRSIGKQHIERAMPRNLRHQFDQCPG